MRHKTVCCLVWGILIGFLFNGCALMGRAPLDVLHYSSGVKPLGHKRLIIFMRGLGGSNKSFEKEGLVADIRNRHMPYDMVAPDADLEYYLGRTLIQRMKADVIDPAKAAGYKEIWLIGFSMGGLGSLLYLKAHPEDIQGVYLISPFLSYRFIQDEITEAGGLRRWNPGKYDPNDDWQRMLWDWLKNHVADHPEMNIYLSYGTHDPYVEGQRLLAQILPPGHVRTIAGGHDYKTFRALWHGVLDSGVYVTRMPEATAQKK
jgi:pimeloyl-ACP methyl ester carboxylesterase